MKVVFTNEPEIKRQVIVKVLRIHVGNDGSCSFRGTGKCLCSGYKVAGKTGTAQKIDGKYARENILGHYASTCYGLE